MKTFEHHDAASLDQALELLARYDGKARLMAGGSDLLGALKEGILPEHPQALINLKTIAGLDGIAEQDGGLIIGPLARLSAIIASPLVNGDWHLLAQAARTVAFPQIRNQATIGGNLCQDTRCWYYRYPRQLGGPFSCWRKGEGPCHAVTGDNRYHAVLGGKKCFAAFPSDMAVALAALDAELEITGPGGARRVAVVDFYTPAGPKLEPGELVSKITVPAPPPGAEQRFVKYTLRKPVDFAVASAAVVFVAKDGAYHDVRICLGGVATIPWRAREAEALLEGKKIGEAAANEAADAALAGAKPLKGNAYKIDIAKTLVKRALS